MVIEAQADSSRLFDVLDRVLDKGIVIDAWVRLQLAGLDLITIDARIIVASIETYLVYAEPLRFSGLVARPDLTATERASGARATRRHRYTPKVA